MYAGEIAQTERQGVMDIASDTLTLGQSMIGRRRKKRGSGLLKIIRGTVIASHGILRRSEKNPGKAITATRFERRIMVPIKFKGANDILGKPAHMPDAEILSLPVYTDGRQCVSCWKLSFAERIKTLIFGRVWLSVRSGTTQPPVWLDCSRTVFE